MANKQAWYDIYGNKFPKNRIGKRLPMGVCFISLVDQPAYLCSTEKVRYCIGEKGFLVSKEISKVLQKITMKHGPTYLVCYPGNAELATTIVKMWEETNNTWFAPEGHDRGLMING